MYLMSINGFPLYLLMERLPCQLLSVKLVTGTGYLTLILQECGYLVGGKVEEYEYQVGSLDSGSDWLCYRSPISEIQVLYIVINVDNDQDAKIMQQADKVNSTSCKTTEQVMLPI